MTIIVVDKHNNRTFLIDIAVPGDTSVDDKEQRKVGKYQEVIFLVARS